MNKLESKWRQRRMKTFVRELNLPPKSPLLDDPTKLDSEQIELIMKKIRSEQIESKGMSTNGIKRSAKDFSASMKKMKFDPNLLISLKNTKMHKNKFGGSFSAKRSQFISFKNLMRLVSKGSPIISKLSPRKNNSIDSPIRNNLEPKISKITTSVLKKNRLTWANNHSSCPSSLNSSPRKSIPHKLNFCLKAILPKSPSKFNPKPLIQPSPKHRSKTSCGHATSPFCLNLRTPKAEFSSSDQKKTFFSSNSQSHTGE
jgi:hypothetical protein